MQTIKFQNLGNGLKGINFEAWGGFENFLAATSTGGGGGKSTLLRRIVPWLAKANNMTANAIAGLPFDILKGDSVYDSSDEWKNNLGGMSNPKRLLFTLASSLCGGRAYVIPTVMGSNVVELYYCKPDTIAEYITANGLEYFSRSSDLGLTGNYVPAGEEVNPADFQGEMMYFWLPDSDVEIGPAKCYPMSTALQSTEVLASMDYTVKINAETGFIPPTVLATKGMVGPGEKEKAETKWSNFLKRVGIKPVMVINAESADIKRVGAGMDELQGVYKDLTRQMMENIAASHGIPAALFMSDMAFASEFNEMIKLWYTSSEFVTIYHCIEETFTDQLLARFGLKMQFKPETIDAFQEDENERAGAFKIYIEAGLRPSVVSDMLGLELPEGVESSSLDEKFDRPDPVIQVAQMRNDQMQNEQKKPIEEKPKEKPKKSVLDAEQISQLDLWRQVAQRNNRKGKGNAIDFECKSLPKDMCDCIRAKLKEADNELDVLKAFDIAGDEGVAYTVSYDFTPLMEAIRLEVAGIEKSTNPQALNITVHSYPGEPAKVTVEPANVTVNVPESPPAQVNVKNEIKSDDNQKEFIKQIKKLNGN